MRENYKDAKTTFKIKLPQINRNLGYSYTEISDFGLVIVKKCTLKQFAKT